MVIDVGWKAGHKDHRLGYIDQGHDAVPLFHDGYDHTVDDDIAGVDHTWSVLGPIFKTISLRLIT